MRRCGPRAYPTSDAPDKHKRRAGAAEDKDGAAATAGAPPADARPNFRGVRRYQPLLFCDFTEGGDLVVVERPWPEIARNFPQALHRPRYGT